jgi:spore coat protein U-like protein
MKPPHQNKPNWPGSLLALMVLAALAAGPARASGGANCSVSATPLAFGKYVPTSTSPADFTATISVTCTTSGPTPAAIRGTIALAGGTGPSVRQLTDGVHRLRYQLYLDPTRSVLWGDGNGGSSTASLSGIVAPTTPFRQVLTVYGRILARQSGAPVGLYADQITAVLNY